MNLPVIPVLLPLFSALFLMIWWRPTSGRRRLCAASGALQVVMAVVLVQMTADGSRLILPLGAWWPKLGIVLVVDLFSAIMLLLGAIVSLACMVYGFSASLLRNEHPLRLPLAQFLMTGIQLTFCTGDLFNLFVAFEIMLISSYALLTLEADDWDIKQAYPYVAINLFGSTLFISAAGLAYGVFGTMGFAEISVLAQGMAHDVRVQGLAALFVVVFGIKAGLFPLYFWLPNSYPTLATPLSALYAGMLTKVGVYVLIRVFGTVLPHELHGIHTLLAWMAGATMILAVLGAISRPFIRGILSFHILSQIGYMVLAIGFFTPLSIAAAIFYIIHHILVKASLFLIGGVAARINGTDNLDRMGNLWRTAPWLGVLFLLQALSLAGIPPLSGFWGKYLIMLEGLRAGEYVLVAAAVVASILTLFSMLKIWMGAFWTERPEAIMRLKNPAWIRMSAVVVFVTALSLLVGFGAEWVMRISITAADSLLDQAGFAADVLGTQGKGAPEAVP